MTKTTLAFGLTFIATFCAALAASAQMAPARAFVPAPPGAIVERQLVGFNSEGIADRWPVLLSKKLVGSAAGRRFYQWYLSIYAPKRGAYRLRYESPGNGGPLSRVTQARDATIWFPMQEARIVGSAPLLRAGIRQLIVASHEIGADCGGATITIFGAKPGNTVGPIATVTNPCDLEAKIGADGASLILTGPYYAANAPLCCPTNAHATATLRYSNGKWTESPKYFKVD
ncbi:MAG: hypothetical protein JOZ77_05000 [Candidatus Eremiobacteraeota bacterium]|nr:hypothetical protein [Candidatus Eremiobacteraeota bacterium]